MAELVPHPFERLVRRAFREFDSHHEIFGLPVRKFVPGDERHDFSVRFHRHIAASPFGPAAGPHTQLTQNIVLAWLAGARVIELKTIQVKDDLCIPRPCIDMRNVGFNVEWSQELRVEQSLEEYVKASMLVDLLVASGKLALAPGFERTVFDMSVGYDLAGIRSEKVRGFLDGMMDARALVDRLRQQIPDELRALRDLDFRTRISDSVTLSTFHGCPPDEIERIGEHLLREVGVDLIVKLNPTLLGPAELRGILNDQLGYSELRVPDDAFEKDATWEQASGIVDRLSGLASSLGKSFGVKLTNTLIVENKGEVFPASETRRYLSGTPLHVLAMRLVQRFRERFGNRIPVSFSAGIDKTNFANAVSLGLVPVTVCSDLLKQGGYGRAQAYFQALAKAMDEAGARNIDELVVRGRPGGRDAAVLENTREYVATLVSDPRYAKAKNSATPKKVGSTLGMFDCLTCDLCIPVCPNNANFVLDLPKDGVFGLKQRHQIGNFAEFCNECGNCDAFCPEEGGPYRKKPRFFGSLDEWERQKERDGFFVSRGHVAGRISGVEYHATEGTTEVNPEVFRLMEAFRTTLLASGAISYVSDLGGE